MKNLINLIFFIDNLDNVPTINAKLLINFD